MDLVLLSAISYLLSGIFWTFGDIWIVGYDENKKRVLELQESGLGKNDAQLIAIYEDADEKRLRKGALIANYTVIFMFGGLYSLWSFNHGTIGSIGIILLCIGYSLSPLAHCAYYYVGIAAKDYFRNNDNRDVLKSSIRFLYLVWVPAIAISFLGYLLYAVAILLGQVDLPLWMGILNPFVLSILFGLFTKLPYPGKPNLDGAIFNLALCLWSIFLILQII
ncbi:MAG: hypothetical protein Q4Q07_10870 [Tissierellia bacterium]|nr:hypothetical protein [Tissierellia bacterium]